MSTAAISKVATVAELRDQVLAPKGFAPEYVRRMLHDVPDLPIVPDRNAYLLAKVADKIVLDLGCTGQISENIRKTAKGYYGVDVTPGDWVSLDMDEQPDQLPVYSDVTLIVMSELLEHLTNPGRCLRAIKALYPTLPILITVPNAGAYTVVNRCEMVNRDHVAWYSYSTLKRLLEKTGYVGYEMRWYHGQPHKAEGLIVTARPA